MRWTERPRGFVAAATLLALTAVFAVAGCGDDNGTNPPINNPPPAGATTFVGTVSGSGVSGSISINVATASPTPQTIRMSARALVTATGTLRITGADTVSMTGSYDDSADLLTLTGGGWTVTGQLTSGGMEGTVAGPGTSAVFSAQEVGTGADSVWVVLGTFASTTGGPGGIFNFAIRDTVVSGNAFTTGSTVAIALDGEFEPVAPGAGSVVIVNPDSPLGPPLAEGSVQGNGSASGTYLNGADAGTWQGQRQTGISPPPTLHGFRP